MVSLAAGTAIAEPVITLGASPAPARTESAPCIVAGMLCQAPASTSQISTAVPQPGTPPTAYQKIVPASNVAPLQSSPEALADIRVASTLSAAAVGNPWSGPAEPLTVAAVDLGSVNLDTGLPETDHAYVGTDSYNVLAVPEPSTWGMLLSGLALFGWIARRRVLT